MSEFVCPHCEEIVSSPGGIAEPWVKVDRKWWGIHRASDRQRRRVVDAGLRLLPWLKRWQERGVSPDVTELITTLDAVNEMVEDRA